MIPRARFALLWVGFGAGLLALGYLLLNTTFMLYDDEGYLLLSIRSFLEGGVLYDEVFSQYGPWPYLYHQLATAAVHTPLTHMFGRGLTLVHWVGVCLLCGWVAQRLTARSWAGFIAAMLSFGLLWQMTSEPSHPGSHIALLVALAAAIVITLPTAPRPRVATAALGALAAAVVLTKINVGAFLIAGLGAIALRFSATAPRWTRVGNGLATAGLVALPWLLMKSRLDDPRMLTFAAQFSLAAIALAWITPGETAGRPIATRNWMACIAAFAIGTALIVAGVMLQGTSFSALVDSVLINPLRHPGSFTVGFTWVSAVWPVTIVSILIAARAGWELRTRGELATATRAIVIATRLVAILVLAWKTRDWLTIHGVGRYIVFCLPLLPLFVIPLARRTPRLPVVLLAYLALPQILHAFPVAGSQMGWGTFLFVPLMIAGCSDCLGELSRGASPGARWLSRGGWCVLGAVVVIQAGLLTREGVTRYRTSQPLGLPGAEDIRLPGPMRSTVRLLSLNASIHADLLFSRPGMFSYNLWSGVPTPTAANATHWFWLLDEAKQHEIAETLRRTPRSAIITSRDLEEFLVKIDVPVKGPLHEFIEQHYEPLLEYRNFEFLTPRGSSAVPFGRAQVLAGESGSSEAGKLAIVANIPLSGRPARAQLQGSSHPWAVLKAFTGDDPLVAQAIDTRGKALAPETALLDGSRELNGLYRVLVPLERLPDGFRELAGQNDLVFTITDDAGRILGEAVF